MKVLNIVNHDNDFANLGFTPIILNDLPSRTNDERKHINDLIMTTYNHTDVLESIPVCSPACGNLSYGYNLGRTCPKCGNRVERPTDRSIESNVWFRAPEGMVGLISPILWHMLSKNMTRSGFNALKWFCDTYQVLSDKKLTVAAKDMVANLEASGVPRGYNSFITHFDKLIPILAACARDAVSRVELELFLISNRDKFFTQHIPLPSKIAFVIENTSTGNFADLTMVNAINAVRTITSMTWSTDATLRKIESKTVSIIDSLATYYKHTLGEPFSSKGGWIRRSMLGTRVPFSLRTVIVSGGTTSIEPYDAVQIPYSQAVTMLKVHLLNKLDKLGYSYKDAWDLVDMYSVKQHPLLCDLLMEIIQETPDAKGLVSLWIRYPALNRGSIQNLNITGFTEHSSTFNVMVTKAPNADFDGDRH